MFKRILVAMDLDEPGSWGEALPAATALASAFGAEIHVTTIVRDLEAMIDAPRSATAYKAMLGEARDRLAKLCEVHLPGEPIARIHVGTGSVSHGIIRVQQELGADLILLASHRPGLRNYLLGANAARVVQHAACSVLVVRDGPGRTT